VLSSGVDLVTRYPGKNVTSGAQPVRQIPKASGQKSTVQQSAVRTNSFIRGHNSQLISDKTHCGGILLGAARPSSDESIETVSDLDWEKESSTRYELASPKSRALQLRLNEASHISVTRHRSKSEHEHLGKVSRSDMMLEHKLDGLTNAMQCLTSCMQEIVGKIDVVQKLIGVNAVENTGVIRHRKESFSTALAAGRCSKYRRQETQHQSRKNSDKVGLQDDQYEWDSEDELHRHRPNCSAVYEQESTELTSSGHRELQRNSKSREKAIDYKTSSPIHTGVDSSDHGRPIEAEHRREYRKHDRNESRFSVLQQERTPMHNDQRRIASKSSNKPKNGDKEQITSVTEGHKGQPRNNVTNQRQFPMDQTDEHPECYETVEITRNEADGVESKRKLYPANNYAGGRSKPRMLPDKYNGNSPVESFRVQFEDCAAYNEWDCEDKVAYLRWCLTGQATQVLWDVPYGQITYEELMRRVIQRFGNEGQEEMFRSQLRNRKRKRGETLQNLYNDIWRLMSLAYPGFEASQFSQLIAKDIFLSSLDDVNLEMRCREREPKDIDEALRIALRLEQYERVVDRSSGNFRFNRNVRQSDDNKALNDKVRELGRQLKVLQKKVEDNEKVAGCIKNGRNKRAATRTKNAQITAANKGQNTLQPATLKPQQLSLTTVSEAASSDDLYSSPRREFDVCSNSDSNNQMTDFEGEQDESSDRSASNEQTQNNTPGTGNTVTGTVYLRASINGKVYKCYLEPDNEITVFPRHMFTQKSNECTQLSSHFTTISTAETLASENEREINFNFSGRLLKVCGVISETVDDIFLGNNFLVANEAELDFDQDYLYMHGWKFKLFPRTTRARCGRTACDKTSTSAISQRSLMFDVQYPPRCQKYKALVTYKNDSSYKQVRRRRTISITMPVLDTAQSVRWQN